jgi:hypothetical protein
MGHACFSTSGNDGDQNSAPTMASHLVAATAMLSWHVSCQSAKRCGSLCGATSGPTRFWSRRPWLGATTRRLTMPCWPWHLPLADRPLLHDGMPHRAHCERQVSHYVRKRPQGTPRAAWERGRVARPLKGQRCSCGRQPSLAPSTRRMWAGVGQVLSPATPAQRTGSVAKLPFGGRNRKWDLGKSMPWEPQLSCFR